MKVNIPDETKFRMDAGFTAFIRLAKANGFEFETMEQAWQVYKRDEYPVLKQHKDRYKKVKDPKPAGNTLLTGLDPV